MNIRARTIVAWAKRLAALVVITAACTSICRADYETAHKAYLSGNKAALLDDLLAMAASRRFNEFELWRLTMMQRLPTLTGSVAREDAQKVLQVLADGLYQAKQAESLVKLVPLMQQFGYEDDVYKTYELAAQLDHLPAILQLRNLAQIRGDTATQLTLDEKAAVLGDHKAMYRTACAYLGDVLEDGWRTKFSFPLNTPNVTFGCAFFHQTPDAKKAFEWFRKAALAASGSETSFPLGWMHFRGIGTPVDHKKAFQISMEIARRMHPNLGPNDYCFGLLGALLEQMFRQGLGTEKNDRQADYFKNRQLCMPPPITK